MNYGSIYTTQNVSAVNIASTSIALAANPKRIAWSIQNLGANVLYVRFGSGATTTDFNLVLKAGTGTDDGTGGSLSQESGTIYNGIITIAGTSPRYSSFEFAP